MIDPAGLQGPAGSLLAPVARVWSRIHFRTSDEVAIDIGTEAAGVILDRYFPARP